MPPTSSSQEISTKHPAARAAERRRDCGGAHHSRLSPTAAASIDGLKSHIARSFDYRKASTPAKTYAKTKISDKVETSKTGLKEEG